MRKLLFALFFIPSLAHSAFRTDWLQNTSSSMTVNGTTYTWTAGTGGLGQFLMNNNGVITSSAPTVSGSISIDTNTTGSGNFIWNTNTQQTNPSQFYVSSGTISQRFIVSAATDSFGNSQAITIHSPLSLTSFGIRMDGYYTDGIYLEGEYKTNNNSIANFFAFQDSSLFDPSISTGRSAWSFAGSPIIYGTNTATSLYGMIASPSSRSFGAVYTSTLTNIIGFYSNPLWASSGRVEHYSMFEATNSLITGGSVGNAYGLRLGDITGATTNYALKTGRGINVFGDSLTIDRPDLGTGLVNRGKFVMEPNAQSPSYDIYVFDAIAPSAGLQVYNQNSYLVGRSQFGVGNGASYSVSLSSCATCSPQSMYVISAQTSEQQFLNNQASEIFRINNSSSGVTATRPFVYYDTDNSNFVGFKASGTISSNVTWTLPAADASGCFQSNGSGIVTIGSCGSGGGGGGSSRVESDGVFVVNTTTLNFNTGISASDSSGEASVILNPSSYLGNQSWSDGAADTNIDVVYNISVGTPPEWNYSDNQIATSNNFKFTTLDPNKPLQLNSSSIVVAEPINLADTTNDVTGVLPSSNFASNATYYIQNTGSLQAGSTFFVRQGNITDKGLTTTDASGNYVTLNGTGLTSIFSGGTDTTFTFDGTNATYQSSLGDFTKIGTDRIRWGSTTVLGDGSQAYVIGAPGQGLSNSHGGTLNIRSGIALGNGQSFIQLQAVAPGQGSGSTQRNPTTSLSIGGSTITAYVPVRLFNQSDVGFSDSDSSHYVAFKSSSVLTSSNTYVWMASSGTAGQAILTDGSNNLYFGTLTASITPGDTNYIQVRNSLQSGATFYVSSGTVKGDFNVIRSTNNNVLMSVSSSGNGGVNIFNRADTYSYTATSLLPTTTHYGRLVVAPIQTQLGYTIAPLDIDFSSSSAGNFSMRFFDPTVSGVGGLSPGDPRTYFDAIAGMRTISYITISGAFSGSGDSFRINDPFTQITQPYMLGIRSDIDDAAVQINANNLNGSTNNGYVFLTGAFTNQQTWALSAMGIMYWSSGTTQGVNQLPSANPNFDTNLYRASQDRLATDDSFDVGVDLTVGGAGTIGSTLFVDSVGGIAQSQFGASPPSEIVSFGSGDRLGVSLDDANTSGARRAGVFVAYFNGTGNHSGSFQANNGFAGTTLSTNGNLTNVANGGGIKVYRGVADHNGTGTVSQASSFTGGARLDSTGTITDVASFHSEGLLARTTGGRVDRYSHFWIRNGVAISTIQYGLRIDAQTIGTTNYAIAIDGTGEGSAIFFNTPTRDGREKIGSYSTGVLDIFAGSTTTIRSQGFRLNAYSSQTVVTIGDIAIDTNSISSSMGTMLIHDGTQLLNVVVTTNTPSNGQIPKYNSSTGKIIWDSDNGGTGSPGGSDTQVQFNDGGSFGGDAELTYDKTGNVLTVGSGQLIVDASDLLFNTGNDTVTFNYPGSPGAGIGTITVPTATGTLSLIEVDETFTGNKQFSSGIGVQEGSNEFMGVSTLVAGTVTVSNTSVTSSSRIFLTAQNSSGSAGEVYISGRSSGTSFTITSTNILDTRDIAWLIIEPY